MSKRADAPYRSGVGGLHHTKCANAQEFVVGGYSPSSVLPRAIGALAVGYYDNGRLIYAGRIGTGYSQAVARICGSGCIRWRSPSRRSIRSPTPSAAVATFAGS